MAEAFSTPFKITLPSGTELFGFTKTGYIKDGNNVKPDKSTGSVIEYWTEVPRSDWDGPSETQIQYAAPGTGSPKFYKLQAAYNVDGNKKWTTYSFAGTELKQELAKYDAGKPTQISTVVATAPQAVARAANVSPSGLAATLLNKNVAQSNPDDDVPTPPGSDPGSGSADNTGPLKFPDVPIPDESAYNTKAKQEKTKGAFLTYPIGIKKNLQDHIVFKRCQYRPKKLSDTSTTDSYAGEVISTIILPIQSGISDTNSVEWGGSNLNEIEKFMASRAMEVMNPDSKLSEIGANALDDAYTRYIKEIPGMYKYYFAQEAVGVQGLLSRASGSVLNPNLSLLFNGPSLRPFSFTFRLTPRSKDEGRAVRSIIRQFKEGSAVNTSQNNVFLKAPDVFKIEYLQLGEKATALNLFKTCALTTVSVNYTPDGTYMTYGDGTMTSYELNLTFNELDPIYQSDYSEIAIDSIGY